MGLFSRKSDAEIKRIRDNDVEAAHRARKWGLASARKWEKRVLEADNELARRSTKAIKEAGQQLADAHQMADAVQEEGHARYVPAFVQREVDRTRKEARRYGYSDAQIEFEARKAARRW
ncbi:hypothetical protein AB0C93_30265 [Streptomyces sp. NPDC048518]|uniref:hypothetical protein n=1 Tax=Streptomyces sp. NPDC048518 TaxID=3155029 RepID=UPI003400977D